MAKLPKASDLLDEKKETSIFAKIILPFLNKGFAKGVLIGSAQGSGDTKPSDVMDKKIRKGIKKISFASAASSVSTSEKRLQTTINNVLKDDGTVQDLARAIKKQYAVQSRPRALLIARTELTGTIGNGTTEGLKAEGYIEHEWITNIDSKERASHRAVHGTKIKFDEKFNVGQGQGKYPGDSQLPVEERANCRCTTVSAGPRIRNASRFAGIFLRIHGRLEISMTARLTKEFKKQGKRVLKSLSRFE